MLSSVLSHFICLIKIKIKIGFFLLSLKTFFLTYKLQKYMIYVIFNTNFKENKSIEY